MAADGRADWREQIVERDARGSGKRAPRKRRATSIQSTVQSDSIIALSQRSEEFCNTIRPETERAAG
jgi:hypothetical protein